MELVCDLSTAAFPPLAQASKPETGDTATTQVSTIGESDIQHCIDEHHQDTSQITKQLELQNIVHTAVPGWATCQFDSSAERNPVGTTKPGGTSIITVG